MALSPIFFFCRFLFFNDVLSSKNCFYISKLQTKVAALSIFSKPTIMVASSCLLNAGCLFVLTSCQFVRLFSSLQSFN